MARHIVARTTEIPPGGNKVVDVDGRDIVVFHVNGEFFALLNRCPHEGAPLDKAACVARLEAGDFYILCPDNDVPRARDEKRMLWAAGDIVENRPPLSRWHPDYADAFKRFVEGE